MSFIIFHRQKLFSTGIPLKSTFCTLPSITPVCYKNCAGGDNIALAMKRKTTRKPQPPVQTNKTWRDVFLGVIPQDNNQLNQLMNSLTGLLCAIHLWWK